MHRVGHPAMDPSQLGFVLLQQFLLELRMPGLAAPRTEKRQLDLSLKKCPGIV